MRITLVISSLRTGGAERVATALSNEWADRRHVVSVITLDGPGADHYRLDARVRRIALGICGATRGLRRKVYMSVRRVQKLRAALLDCNSEVVVSFTDCTNVLTLCATRGTSIPVIVAERTDPSQHDIGPLWSTLRRLTYRSASAIVVQTDAARRWAQQSFPQVPAITIPNPVLVSHQETSVVRQPMIVSVGRLEPVKRFDLLIDSFALVAQRHRQWSLEIIGDGSKRSDLQQLVASRQLQGQVLLHGQVADPQPYLRRASLFVLSSEYEGFPNALLEAMACGLPVVSTDCPAGPAAIIRHGVDGLLVPNKDKLALSRAIEQLVQDPVARARMAAAAREVQQRFSLPSVLHRWNEALSYAIYRSTHRRVAVESAA